MHWTAASERHLKRQRYFFLSEGDEPCCRMSASGLRSTRLAARYSLSASGLAKRAGLDSTAFNKSKRQSADGRPRWPSTESLAKIIEATNSSLDEFFSLVEGKPHGAAGAAAADAGVHRAADRLRAGRRRRLLRRCRLSGRPGLGPDRTAGDGGRRLLCAAGAGRFHAAALPRRRHAGRAARAPRSARATASW